MNNAEQALRRFVLRARRIQAHSLVRDRKKLAELAQLQYEVAITDEGTVEMRQRLPDEEVFESLAARLRPLVLQSESVYYETVLDALDSVLAEATAEDIEELRLHAQRLRGFWALHVDKALPAVRYTTQARRADGSEVTPLAADSQVAMAWLYGDLVHVDVQGKKIAGTYFPLKERFAAAVPYFATIAVACLRTFDLVSILIERDILTIDEDAMNLSVVVGTDELITTGTAYIAPAGTELPDLAEAISGNIPEEFQQLTVNEIARIKKSDHAQIRLKTVDGNTLVTYDAKVTHNRTEGDHQEVHVRVAEIFTWKVTFRLKQQKKTLHKLDVTVEELTTNQRLLEKFQFERNLARSVRQGFSLPQIGTFSVSPGTISKDAIKDLDIYVETLMDIVRIEEITSQPLGMPNGTLTPEGRAMLRVNKLLWEGDVVPFTTGPISITNGAETEPKLLVEQAQFSEVAGLEVPRPAICIWHPLMSAKNIQHVMGSEPPKASTQMVVPVEEPFVAWAPQRRNDTNQAAFRHPTDWGLSHFDLSAFLATTWRVADGLTESPTSTS